MFEVIGLIIFGFFVGTYGTLIGIGGGPLIVPFLLFFYKLPPTAIVATSLCVVFFNVASGSIAYYRQKRIDIISGTKFGIATIPGAILGTYIPQFFTSRFLGIVFGILLFILAVYVFMSEESAIPPVRSRRKGSNEESNHEIPNMVKRVIIDTSGNKYVYKFNEKLGLAFSAVIGFVATMLGIGGGVFHVPMLTKILNFPVHIATATAHYKLFICALFGSVLYLHKGYIIFGIAIPIAIGAVFGARLGAILSKKLSGRKIFRLLAIALIVLAFRLLFYG